MADEPVARALTLNLSDDLPVNDRVSAAVGRSLELAYGVRGIPSSEVFGGLTLTAPQGQVASEYLTPDQRREALTLLLSTIAAVARNTWGLSSRDKILILELLLTLYSAVVATLSLVD